MKKYTLQSSFIFIRFLFITLILIFLSIPAQAFNLFLHHYTEYMTCNRHKGWVNSVALSPNGKLVASRSTDGFLRIWHRDDITDSKSYANLVTPSQGTMIFLPDNQHLISSSIDEKNIKIIDIETGHVTRELRGHRANVTTMALADDSSLLISGAKGGEVCLWINEEDGMKLHKKIKCSSSSSASLLIHAIAVGTDHVHNRKVVAFGLSTGIIEVKYFDNITYHLVESKILTMRTEKPPISSFELNHPPAALSLALSHDATKLICGSMKGNIRIFSLKNGQCLKVFNAHAGWITSIFFIKESTIIASASHDQTIKLWDSQTAECLQILRGHTAPIDALSLSSDGVMATASRDKSVRIWLCG